MGFFDFIDDAVSYIRYQAADDLCQGVKNAASLAGDIAELPSFVVKEAANTTREIAGIITEGAVSTVKSVAGEGVVSDFADLTRDAVMLPFEVSAGAAEMVSEVTGAVVEAGNKVVEVGADAAGAVAGKTIDVVAEHPVEVAMAVGMVAGGLAAPMLASKLGAWGVLNNVATTGKAISSLHGAALKSASLAKLGGGAKAIGGLGMKGGVAVVSSSGSVASGATAAALKKHKKS